MASVFPPPPTGARRTRLVVATLFGLLTVGLLWPSLDMLYGSTGPEFTYGDQAGILAFNIARYGEFHDSARLADNRAGESLKPYHRREPGFPMFLAGIFLTFPEVRASTYPCFSKTECEHAYAVHRRVLHVTAILAAVTVALTVVAAHFLYGKLVAVHLGRLLVYDADFRREVGLSVGRILPACSCGPRR